MENSVPRVADELGLDDKKVKLNHAGNLGYHYRVSRKDEKALRDCKTYTALETRKDGVRFTNSHMKDLSCVYEDLAREYSETQKDVVDKVLNIAKGYAPIFATLSTLYADLDAFASLAHVAVNSSPPYVRPTLLPRSSECNSSSSSSASAMTDENRNADGSNIVSAIRLRGARHPCLEVQQGESFIANDIELVKGKSNVQIVTGPKMGGKSTYIRTAGCIAVMAQMGSFVPCTSAELSVLDGVQARVGAGDSQMKGMSTFMKEMLEAAAILKSATSDSLIIIDELGRGTSTYDGFGLAWAIAEHIASKINAFALFATHFHELTTLAVESNNIVNRHVTAQTGAGTITMLYRLQPGACDRSFGIHVAELVSFPPEVVALARAKAAELEAFGNESQAFVAAQQDAASRSASASASAAVECKSEGGAAAAAAAVAAVSDDGALAFLRALFDSEVTVGSASAGEGDNLEIDALIAKATAVGLV